MYAHTTTLPDRGVILAVRMPCSREALAEVLTIERTPGSGRPAGIRVKWLPATGEYIRGYRIVWDKQIETIETSLPWPPNPDETSHGTRQTPISAAKSRASIMEALHAPM